MRAEDRRADLPSLEVVRGVVAARTVTDAHVVEAVREAPMAPRVKDSSPKR